MKECIVHFKLKKNDTIKQLRGLIFVEKGTMPNTEDLIQCFADMELHVQLEDEHKLIFRSSESENPYTIEVTSLDCGIDPLIHDPALKALAEHFIKERSKSL